MLLDLPESFLWCHVSLSSSSMLENPPKSGHKKTAANLSPIVLHSALLFFPSSSLSLNSWWWQLIYHRRISEDYSYGCPNLALLLLFGILGCLYRSLLLCIIFRRPWLNPRWPVNWDGTKKEIVNSWNSGFFEGQNEICLSGLVWAFFFKKKSNDQRLLTPEGNEPRNNEISSRRGSGKWWNWGVGGNTCLAFMYVCMHVCIWMASIRTSGTHGDSIRYNPSSLQWLTSSPPYSMSGHLVAIWNGR